MKNSLDYLKEACPEHWAEIDKYPVDKMLELMDIAISDAYNQALEDAAENVEITPVYTKACDDHTPYWGPCCSCGQYDNPDIKVGDYVNKQSILKLKKP